MKSSFLPIIAATLLVGCAKDTATDPAKERIKSIIGRLAKLNPYHGYSYIDAQIDTVKNVTLSISQYGDSSFLIASNNLPIKLISLDTVAQIAVFSAVTAPLNLTYNYGLDTVYYAYTPGGIHSERTYLHYP